MMLAKTWKPYEYSPGRWDLLQVTGEKANGAPFCAGVTVKGVRLRKTAPILGGYSGYHVTAFQKYAKLHGWHIVHVATWEQE